MEKNECLFNLAPNELNRKYVQCGFVLFLLLFDIFSIFVLSFVVFVCWWCSSVVVSFFVNLVFVRCFCCFCCYLVVLLLFFKV